MAGEPTRGAHDPGDPDGHTPPPRDSPADPDAHRLVGRTEVLPGVGVETAFVGHGMAPSRRARFFETVVSAPGYPRVHGRAAGYKTWGEAVEGHEATVARVRETLRADWAYRGAATPRVVLVGEGQAGRQVLARLIAAGVPAADCMAVDTEVPAPAGAAR